jgi:2-methylcitrate dehydratase
VRENTTFTAEYYAADKRSIGNAVQVFFKDGTSTERLALDFPVGHQKRRAEGIPLLIKKFSASVADHFPVKQSDSINALFADRTKLEALAVSEFVAALVRN